MVINSADVADHSKVLNASKAGSQGNSITHVVLFL